MKKESPKLQKLTLHRDTMRRLTDTQLAPAIGGNTEPADFTGSMPISKCGQSC